MLKPYTITDQAQPDQIGTAQPPKTVTLGGKIVELLEKNDPGSPAEYRSNTLTFLDVFMHTGKDTIHSKYSQA